MNMDYNKIIQTLLSGLQGLAPASKNQFDYRSPERIRAEGPLPGQSLDPKNDPNSMKLNVGVAPDFVNEMASGKVDIPNPAVEAIANQLSNRQPADPNFRFAFENLPRDKGWSEGGPRPNFNPKQPPADIAEIIRRIFPNEATTAAAVAGSENGRYEPGPSADNVWNEDGSIDRGIFAINSNTFNGLMSRQGDKLRKMGISSFEDMYDPEKNMIVAKMIREGARDYRPETNPEGWGGWFGWQDVGFDLNKGYFTKGDRVDYELKKQKKK